MLAMGEGTNPRTPEFQAPGKQYGIKDARKILAKLKRPVVNWFRYAELAELSRKPTKEIAHKMKLQ